MYKKAVVIGIIFLFLFSSFTTITGLQQSLLIETKKEEQQKFIISNGPMDSPWPMKCHDNRHTSQSPFNTDYNSGGEKWRFKSDCIESSPIIDSGGTIYFGSFDGFLYAINPNGTMKWKYKTNHIIWSTPVIDKDGTIYVASYDDFLHAVYHNGTRKWRFCSSDSITSSPTIGFDGTIYFGTMGSIYHGGCNVFAVNPNGTEKWHYQTGDIVTSDPAIGDNGIVYIGSCDDYLYAFYPNGTLQWRFQTGGDIRGHPSIAEDGTIYAPSFDSYLYAINPDGSLKWRVNTGYGTASASIDGNGTIYAGTNKIRAFYPDGTLKWSFDVGGSIEHPSLAISANGVIYASTCNNKCLLAVNPDGTERWRLKISNLRAKSSPCIGEDGTIYVGSSWEDENNDWYGYLHAINRGKLMACANGPYVGLVNQTVHLSGSAAGGYPPYSWEWSFGDGDKSYEQNPTHIYSRTSNYTVNLTVTDNEGNISNDTTWTNIRGHNNPPTPPIIDGPTEGKAGESYDYTFTTIDPDNDEIHLYVDWGDDQVEEWIGPYSSGEDVTLSHAWNEKGTYEIKAKAKDIFDEESDWATLEVTIPRNKPIISLFESRFPRLFNLLGRDL